MLTQVIVWLNGAANWVIGTPLRLIGWMPGWLSATWIAVVTGILTLLVFKWTSNQHAIQETRRQIKANLLALSLFKDDLRVGLRAQRRLLAGAGRLIVLSTVPMLVLAVPLGLALGQLALWYQARPLGIGEESIITVELSKDAKEALRRIQLQPAEAVAVLVGPVRVPSKSMVCWSIRAAQRGKHELCFRVGDVSFEKELVVGDHYLPTSRKRPAWNWSDALLHPRERPFPRDSVVQSIEVAYPERDAFSSGSNSWLIYWLLVSLATAFAAKPLLRVHF